MADAAEPVVDDGSQSPDRKRQHQDDDTEDASRKRQATDADAEADAGAVTPPPAEPEAAPEESSTAATAAALPVPPEGMPTIAMRALIHNQDAGLIIGKGGRSVAEIREGSGARVTVSEHIPGVTERILTMTGPLDHVAKAFSLVSQRIADGQISEEHRASLPPGPQDPKQRHVQLRLLVPHTRMGGVIGKAGSKIKEIQDLSGARVSASEEILPGSSERLVSITGIADSIHIATYHIGQVIQDTDGRGAALIPYRPGHGAPPPRSERPRSSAPPPSNSSTSPTQQSVQIYIPNDMVGAIIGKAGSKINSIRQQSGCRITIAEPDAAGGERLVTIMGSADANQMALYLLYSSMEAVRQGQQA